MKEEELKLLENEFCLGCARSCDLLHPSCERGLVKMQEILEECELPRLNTPYLKSRLLECLRFRLRSLIFKSPPIS